MISTERVNHNTSRDAEELGPESTNFELFETYPLGICCIAMERSTIFEWESSLFLSMARFHSYVTNYQRVPDNYSC